MRRICIAAIAFVLQSSTGALAQTGAPLFSTHDVLQLTLAAPIRTLERRKTRRPEVDGVLSYQSSDATEVELDLTVTPRGNSRLEICSFPPLWLDLKRSQLDGTVFEGQNRLKLVTLCARQGMFEDYLELEYIAYRIYNEMTDASFRVRPVRMTYVDTERDNRVTEAPAFLVEHANGLAERIGMTSVDVESVDASRLTEPEMTKFWVFQFLIGNTDISDTSPAGDDDCCHNSAVLASEADGARFIAVPYDFDFSGLVDADYALPDERLNLKSVRQRIYRGRCVSNQYLDETIAQLNAARPRIESFFQSERLSESARKKALEYIDEGFETLNDAEELQSSIVARCSNRGTSTD